MEIIAHRGASHDAPENTLAAVNLAWEQGADAVEIDVHLSEDGKLVVIHDENTKRLARQNKKVSCQTLACLRALDVGRWKGEKWVREGIPTLEEVLDTLRPGRRLFIEIKSEGAIVPELTRELKRSRQETNQIAIIGFSLPTMRAVKEAISKVEVCWLVGFGRIWKSGRWVIPRERPVRSARDAGLDGIGLDARGPIRPVIVQHAHEEGLKVYVWTVDSAAKAKVFAATGVDGIITNRPGWLREKLK